MPINPTYPGVYVQELSSGVRTIAGVSTSTTAFIGRARRGPVNQPITINGYSDFERIFGGLTLDSPLTFAVRDYFLNGGTQAIIVRLVNGAGTGLLRMVRPSDTKTELFQLIAANPGSHSVDLRAEITTDVTAEDRVGQDPALQLGDLFNLTVTEPGGRVERFRSLSFKEGPRRIDRVLAAESKLVRFRGIVTQAKAGDPEKVDSSPTSLFSASGQSVPVISDELTALEAKAAAAKKAFDASKPGDSNRDALTKSSQDASTELTSARSARSASATDGAALTSEQFIGVGLSGRKEGLFALERVDLFNLLCIPPHSFSSAGDLGTDLVAAAATYCETRRAFLILDPPSGWTDKDGARDGITNTTDQIGTRSKNAALFFPRLRQPNPLRGGRMEDFAPCGAVAGLIARGDRTRGLWKAPAGVEATLVGVPDLSVQLTDGENGELNPLGINCLRALPEVGRVVWGSRTLQGSDRLGSEWKYLPVRRLALYLEESLFRGTQWVVFEPNSDALWAQIRLNVGVFLHSLFRQGAFAGQSPRDAYFVKCDAESTTQDDVNRGVVNVVIGFAPLKPAEFVVLQFQQIAGQLQA
jgi:phage tail sheath protein FI